MNSMINLKNYKMGSLNTTSITSMLISFFYQGIFIYSLALR